MLSNAEEAYKRQKSRINWLALGDKNTKFFHHKMNAHRVRNTILSLVNNQGATLDNPEAIEEEILNYYKGLLGSPFSQKRDACGTLEVVIKKRIPQDLKDSLTVPVCEDEILKALKSIHKDKAPGPDGFNSAFFQDNWDIVKEDFVAGILFFFESGTLPVGWNATAVTLVPKVAAPHSVKDYRPIAYCNTVYRCLSKILANRLQCVLPSIIGPSICFYLR